MPRTIVSSANNPTIKRLIALRDRRSVRQAERLFIVEGPRFVWDAARSQTPAMLVGTAAALDAWDIPEEIDTVEVPDSLFLHVSDTKSPQGVLGVHAFPDLRPQSDLASLVVIADGIQDPGNLGTLVRSAVAFGGTQVICLKGTVDPWSPKVVRAAAGAHFLVPIEIRPQEDVQLDGLQVVIADEEATTPPFRINWLLPTALVIGGEAHGVRTALRDLVHEAVSIPMDPRLDSLNAGIAASVLLYEADRQRREQG